MDAYLNAVLIEIVEKNIIEIDGKKYLVMLDKDYTRTRPVAKLRQNTSRTNVKQEIRDSSIIQILKEHPDATNKTIRIALEEIEGSLITQGRMTQCLINMRERGLVTSVGTKNFTLWNVAS